MYLLYGRKIYRMDNEKLLNFIKDELSNNGRNNRYHFRDRYKHTLRVLKWAKRLHKIEGGNLEIIRIAILFHDIGWDENLGHNIVSKNIAKNYLEKTNYDPVNIEKILEAIEYHCLRESDKQLNIESYIVMDADILDEVGAVSIIWDAMATMCEDAPSYLKAYERIKKYSSKIKQNKKLLRTETGKKYYNNRVKFIYEFIEELEFELF